MSTLTPELPTAAATRRAKKQLGDVPPRYDRMLQQRYTEKLDCLQDSFSQAMLNKKDLDNHIRSVDRDMRRPTFDPRVHRASHWAHVENLEALLKANASVNTLDDQDKTPLDVAMAGKKLLSQARGIDEIESFAEKENDFKRVIELLQRADAKYGYHVLEEREKMTAIEERHARNKKYMLVSLSISVALGAIVLPILNM